MPLLRTNIAVHEPDLYAQALSMAERAAAAASAAGLPDRLVDLVRIRVSQLNGCAYCLRAHSREALAAGELPDRLAVLPAWREASGYFDAVERRALALAELVTDIGGAAAHQASDRVVAPLTPPQHAAVAWVAISTGTLNRVAVTSHYVVSPAA